MSEKYKQNDILDEDFAEIRKMKHSNFKPYQPKTGQACYCKPGRQRDNCVNCEGTGQKIDFARIRAK